MTAPDGSSINLPFSIDNILREDFGPQRTQSPRYYSSGYSVGTPWPCYYYKYCPILTRWNYFVPFRVPIAGVVQQSTSNLNSSNQGHVEKVHEDSENSTENDEYSSDLDNNGDSDESGKISPSKIDSKVSGKRSYEQETTNSEEPKKKRLRSQFTEMQLKYLENYFSSNPYLSRDERNILAQALDMTELQIRNWFQNKRYQKKHKEGATEHNISSTGKECEPSRTTSCSKT